MVADDYHEGKVFSTKNKDLSLLCEKIILASTEPVLKRLCRRGEKYFLFQNPDLELDGKTVGEFYIDKALFRKVHESDPNLTYNQAHSKILRALFSELQFDAYSLHMTGDVSLRTIYLPRISGELYLMK